MVKRYEHRHGGMMPVNREVDTYVSSSDYAKLEAERDVAKQVSDVLKIRLDKVVAERDRLREALMEIMTYAEIDSSELHHEDQLADIFNHARTALGGG